jgi:hypothetical protein
MVDAPGEKYRKFKEIKKWGKNLTGWSSKSNFGRETKKLIEGYWKRFQKII